MSGFGTKRTLAEPTRPLGQEVAVQVQFWGTRGSIPKPGPTTIHYGGNTLCHEIRTACGTLVIIDCGTGLHGLQSRHSFYFAHLIGKPLRISG